MSTTSETSPEIIEYFPGEWSANPLAAKPVTDGFVTSWLPGRDQQQQARGRNGSGHLGDHVARDVLALESARRPETQRDGRIEVTAAHGPESIGSSDHGKSERQRDTEQADPHGRECRREHGGAASAEHEHERAEELGAEPPHESTPRGPAHGLRWPPR